MAPNSAILTAFQPRPLTPLLHPSASSIPGDSFDLIIIGGGAAGLFCAAEAGRRGLRVLVLEHANKVGKKILMSGGGRCNFTNLFAGPEHYRSTNPHFCRSALAGFSPYEFLAQVESAGIEWVEKAPGQLFCRQSAKDLLKMLLQACEDANVEIAVNSRVEISRISAPFTVSSGTKSFTAPRLVVATGGLSIPKMGASGFGYELARKAGHDILRTRAGLVPFTLTGRPAENFAGLAGISTEVGIQAGIKSYRDALLITHRGLSGPAVLQVSSHWSEGLPIVINWLPQCPANALLEHKRQDARQTLNRWLATQLPERLAERLSQLDGGDIRLGDAKDATLLERLHHLQNWTLKPSGTEGYRTAEVTEGGVATDQISSKTMESQRVPGLYFIGEVIDITGELGGFNFQWAWASAAACARHIPL